MADKKISALPAASTPLAGTEVLPIVQGGTTDQVSVANLTAGRAVNALSATTTAGLRNTSAGSDTASTPDGLFLTDGANKNAIVQLGASGGVSTFIFEAGGAGWRRVAGLLTNGNSVVDVGNLVIGTTAKGLTTGSSIPLGFGTNNSVADMTLNTSGNLVIGSIDFGSRVSVFTDGVGQFIRVQQINATIMEFRNAQDVGGSITIVAGGATFFNTTSDERLKHDIVDAPDAANLIDALKVRSFKWKVDDTAQRYGFIAQELLEVAPEAVSVPEDEDKMMGVDHSKLVPMLVKEVQSLRARVAQLEGK